MSFQNKYLKYKNKYLKLKELLGGSSFEPEQPVSSPSGEGGGGPEPTILSARSASSSTKTTALSAPSAPSAPSSTVSTASAEIRVCSYNILSQPYAENQSCAKHFKDQDYRCKLLILKLIKEIDNNVIICLQEVPRLWLCNRLQNFFNKFNYSVVSDNYDNEASGYMGVLIAYPHKIFSLNNMNISKPIQYCQSNNTKIASELFSQEIINGYKDKEIDDLIKSTFKKLNEKPNTSIKLELQDKVTNIKFCIGTYHSPNVFKEQEFMQLCNSFAAISLRVFAGELPYILAGDFNTQPTDLSYYSLVGQNNNGILTPCDKCKFRLSKPIYSAYFILNNKEPDVTNNGQVHFPNKTNPEPRFIGTLDYIFVSDSRIQVLNTIQLPSREDIEKIDIFPNNTEPSDHLLIGVYLRISN